MTLDVDEFIRAHAKGNGNAGKAKADISIYGQESNYTTWQGVRPLIDDQDETESRGWYVKRNT
jgi:hypothetical protein